MSILETGAAVKVPMLEQGAQKISQTLQAAANLPAPQPTSANVPWRIVPTYQGFHPDSYAYFYHYYLHPRTLASVYQRLGPYAPLSPYANGSQPWIPRSFGPPE